MSEDFKDGIYSFPDWAISTKDNVKKKLASSMVLSLSKALCGVPQSFCGRQVTGSPSLSVELIS